MKRKSSVKVGPKRLLGLPARQLFVLVVVAALIGLLPYVINKNFFQSDAAAQRFPGDPNPLITGKAYYGASNDRLATYESAAGNSVSLYRKFNQWGADQAASVATLIKSNYDDNRLVWVSFKTPTWKSVGNGSQDATLDKMLKTLDDAGHPVWVTFWHEPENDEGASNTGSAADYVAMQKHIRARMTALGTKNIALAPIYMCYWINKDGAAKHNRWWPGSGVYDIYGFDCYQGKAGDDLLGPKWQAAYKDAESKSMPFAVGEYGLVENNPTMMTDFWNWQFSSIKHDRVGISYWDSNGHELTTYTQNKTAFINILKNDARVMRIKSLGSVVTPVADTTQPVVKLTSPAVSKSGLRGTITITGTASDNVGVKAVTLRVDDKFVDTDKTAPYSFSLNTKNYSNGSHTVVLRAFDDADNMGESATATFTFRN